MPSAATMAAVGALTVVAAAASTRFALNGSALVLPAATAAIRTTLVVLYPVVGLYAWLRRPEESFGRVLVVLGLTYALTSPVVSADANAYAVGRLVNVAWIPLYLFAFLSFPSGRLGSRAAQAIIVGYSTVLVVFWPLIALTATKLPSGGVLTACGERCPENPLRVLHVSSGIARVPVVVVSAATIVAVVAVVIVLVRTATAPLAVQQRTVAPVLIAAVVVLVGFAAYSVHPATGTWLKVNLIITGAAALYTPIAFVIGPLRGEIYVSRSLWRGLASVDYTTLSPAGIEELCRQALGDASLRIAVATPRVGLLDLAGGGATDQGSAAATVVDGRNARYVVLHDVSLTRGYRYLVERVGSLAVVLYEYTRLFRDVVGSRRRLARSESDERARLEHDLHDGAQQYLLAVQMKLADIADAVAGSRVEDPVRDVTADVGRAADEVRRIGHGIYPELLLQSGIPAALSEVPTPPSFALAVADEGIGRLDAATERAVYFAIVEAVHNAAKHSGGGRVVVTLSPTARGIEVVVADDGAGFDVAEVEAAGGLTAIRDRIASVGGTAAFAADEGAVVRLSVPSPPREHDPSASGDASGLRRT